MSVNKLQLKNSKGYDIYLKNNNDNTFTLEGDYHLLGINYEDSANILFIEPDGGPHIKVGYFKLSDNRTLASIKRDSAGKIILRFE